jgi:hypothetical protein
MCSLLHGRHQASPYPEGWPPHLCNEAEGFACATDDAFTFSGSDGTVTQAAAESVSWRTSKCHGQHPSTDKSNRALPDAPAYSRQLTTHNCPLTTNN